MTNFEEVIFDNRFTEINPVLFGYGETTPHHSYGPAIRTHWLFHYIIEGRGIFVIDGQTHHLGAGDMFVIPPDKITYYEADGENPWNYTWIGFTSTLELPFLMENHYFHLPAVSEIFFDMKRFRNYENGRSAFLCGHIYEILSIILENDKKNSQYVERAINYIRIKYMNPISIDDIAKQLNISRNYLSNLFKQETGMSPKNYLTKIRLENAVSLMTKFNERPTVAAPAVGYPDFYHFSKIFKQHYGLSPRDYIRKYKENISRVDIDPLPRKNLPGI